MSKGDDDIVGYGKPPRATRFAKGKSGNPEGRPKGARNKPSESRIDAIIMSEGSRLVDVKSDGKVLSMPTFQAIMRKVNVDAMKGDSRAQRLALNTISDAERRADDLKRVTFERALQYKQICEAEMADAYANGRDRPKFPIDPDDIYLDPVAGTVSVSTLTEEENRAVIALHNYRKHWLEDVDGEAEDLVKHLPPSLERAGKDLLSSIQMIKALERLLGGPFELLGDGSIDGLDFEVLKNLGKKS